MLCILLSIVGLQAVEPLLPCWCGDWLLRLDCDDDGDGGREARASVIKCVQQDDRRGRAGGGAGAACVACAYFPLSFSLFCVLNFNEAAAAATRRAKLLRALLRKTAAVGKGEGEGEEQASGSAMLPSIKSPQI